MFERITCLILWYVPSWGQNKSRFQSFAKGVLIFGSNMGKMYLSWNDSNHALMCIFLYYRLVPGIQCQDTQSQSKLVPSCLSLHWTIKGNCCDFYRGFSQRRTFQCDSLPTATGKQWAMLFVVLIRVTKPVLLGGGGSRFHHIGVLIFTTIRWWKRWPRSSVSGEPSGSSRTWWVYSNVCLCDH